MAAARRALGPPPESWVAGLGVTVYAWPALGIWLQRGWRKPELGKLFKLQVWLEDSYDRNEDKHSGRFAGRVSVDGLNLRAGMSLTDLRPALERAGYQQTSNGIFGKGSVSIMAAESNPEKVGRVEIWWEP